MPRQTIFTRFTPATMSMASISLKLVLLLYFCSDITVKGATPVVLSPSGPTYVCSGHQLELICNITGAFQEWDFHISENGTTITHPGRLVSNQPGLITPRVINSISFNFSRVSPANTLPLVTKLVVTPTRSSINGTMVTCTCIDVITNVSSSTTVFAINKNSVTQDHPVVNFTMHPKIDGTNNFTLMWNESVNPALFSYHVNIVPETSYTFAERSATIEVLFHIPYNINVVATHLCGQSTLIISTGLFYLDCKGQCSGISLLEIIDHLNHGARNVTLDGCPAVTSTDAAPFNVTGDGEVEMSSDVSTKTVISSAVSALFVSSVIIFIIGFICEHCIGTQKVKRNIQATNDHHSTTVTNPVAPVYDAVLPTLIREQEQDVELKENVAYM